MNTQAPVPSMTSASATGEIVLVVDDSRAHCRLMSRTLAGWGYQVLEAGSGQEAVAICQAYEISLVISDWMMPGMSGVEFCRCYRDLTAGRPGYFILLTAQTDREVLAEGLESGADDFLSKPVSSIELRARLRAGERVLNAQRAIAAKNDELSATLDRLKEVHTAIDRDLHEARRFQERLVPERFVPFGMTDISLLFRPRGHVGGDMVGYFDVAPGELGIYAVDVSGHGVSSALMTARIASYFSGVAPESNIALCRGTDGYAMLPLDEVCRRLNALLQKDVDSDLYLTMVLAHLATETGDVTICQAGHPSPLVLRADGRTEFKEVHGMPIGLLDAAEFDISRVTLDPGDRLLLYSDGITECPDPEGTLLDEKGLTEIIARHSGLDGPGLLSAIVGALEEYSGSADFPDDLSAVLIEKR